jgi:hypothetical protein
LDEGEVIRGKLVVVEEPFDPIADAVETRAEADRIGAIAFRWDVGRRTFLDGKLSVPVRIVPTVGKQH